MLIFTFILFIKPVGTADYNKNVCYYYFKNVYIHECRYVTVYCHKVENVLDFFQNTKFPAWCMNMSETCVDV